MASLRGSAAYHIAVSFAAALSWAILLLGTAVYFVISADLERQRDRHVAEELSRLWREPSRAELLRELQWREKDSNIKGVRYAVFDREGRRIAGNLDVPAPLPGFTKLPALRGSPEFGTLRLGAADLADGSRVVVGAYSARVDSVLRLVVKIFASAFIAGLAVSIGAGWVLGRYLRYRLKPIHSTANAIVTGDVEWRVPISARGDEFDTAGVAVNLMLDRIAGLMENLRQVSSDIAHDLRKPLIRLLCQADRLGEVAGAEQRVIELGDELLMLFSGILRLSEVEGGGLERNFSPIDFSALMTEVAESFAPPLTDVGDTFQWQIEPGVMVKGSRELLAQLAANLLDNARIHTPAGTAITLSLKSEAGCAILVVVDTGPGVSEIDREKLLYRFFRAEASRTTPGNGLGLSLVAAAARAHGGVVKIEHATPGLRVVVTLPQLDRKPSFDRAIPAQLRTHQ